MLSTSMHDVKEKILLGKKWDLWKGWNKERLARIALGFDKMQEVRRVKTKMSILKEWRLVVYHKTTKFPKILDNKRKKNTWIMPIFESFCTIEQEWKFKRGGKGEKERRLAGRKSLLPFLGQRLWDMLKEEKWVEANIKAIRPFGEVPKRCLKLCEKHSERERERERERGNLLPTKFKAYHFESLLTPCP